MAEDVITQVAPPGSDEKGDLSAVADLPETVALRLRGRRFEVKRERLLSLPESILFGLSSGINATPFSAEDTGESDTMDLDFDPDCFEYILSTLTKLDHGLEPRPVTDFKASRATNHSEEGTGTGRRQTNLYEDGIDDEEDADSVESLAWLPLHSMEVPGVFRDRPALIVLREDLEYYVLGNPALSEEELGNLKDRIGEITAWDSANKNVLNGLRNRETLDSPEYHLMQMLVLVGLSPEQTWEFRSRKPRSSQIISLQLSRVKIPENNSMLEQIYALQKLLLFWRKPAKKCWWDKVEIEGATVHMRRVWTLELSIVGLTG